MTDDRLLEIIEVTVGDADLTPTLDGTVPTQDLILSLHKALMDNSKEVIDYLTIEGVGSTRGR